MGLASIAERIHADQRRQVIHQTWGHLFPKRPETFTGFILIAMSDYGDLTVIKDESNVPSSPWWYECLQDFTADFLMDRGKPGCVFKVAIRSSVVEEDKQQTFEIEAVNVKELEVK